MPKYQLEEDKTIEELEGRIMRTAPFFESMVDMERPEAIEIIGNVETGKSALVALLGEYFYRQGYLVYDLLASDSDHENFNWLVTGPDGKTRYPILLVHSSYSEVYIPPHLEGWVKECTDEHDLYSMAKLCVDEKRVLVFDNASYTPSHYRAILLTWFSEIIQIHRRLFIDYQIKGVVLLREMYKLLPSQGGAKMAKEGGLLKEVVKTMFRERRRGPLFFIGDIQRDIELDKGIRSMMTTRIIRRAPDRMLEQDVLDINKMVTEYYQALERQGGFVQAATKAYPLINHLTNKQCYIQKANGKLYFRNDIPLPGHGYVNAFTETMETKLGLRVKVDFHAQKEFFSVQGKKVDYARWMKRIELEFVESNSWKTAATLMKAIEWESHTGEGLPAFLSMLEVLIKGGFMVKKSDMRKGIPVCFRLVGDEDLMEERDDGSPVVLEPRPTPTHIPQEALGLGLGKLTIDSIDKAMAAYMDVNEQRHRPTPISERYLSKVGAENGQWKLNKSSVSKRLHKWRKLGLVKTAKGKIAYRLIKPAWVQYGMFLELLAAQNTTPRSQFLELGRHTQYCSMGGIFYNPGFYFFSHRILSKIP